MSSSEVYEFQHLADLILPEESSEEDVRLKIVIPLFKLLGYNEDCLATEFPVYGNIGRKKCHTTFADVVYFNDISPSSHRAESERNWVRDHSLVLIELKKPSEDPDPSGQAEYYANWLSTPYIVSTNGNEFIIRLQERYRSPMELMRFRRDELVSRLADIQKILLFQRVEKFVLDQQLKFKNISNINYDGYLSSFYEELKDNLKWPITRSLGIKDNISILDLPLRDKSQYEIKQSEDLLNISEPIMVLGEPGSGKTYLLKHIAQKIIELNPCEGVLRIPIIIEARYWGPNLKTIVEYVFSKLNHFVPGLTLIMVEQELAQSRYWILIDGYDEIRDPNLKTDFRLEVEGIARCRMAKIIMTSREANYHGEFDAHFRAYNIKGISDDQIDSFARDFAGINHFSYDLSKENLLELARLPLYLFMLCKIVIKNKNLPNNKAKIWEEFASVLLNEYPFRRRPAYDPVFSTSQKIDFLSELAKEKAKDVKFHNYAVCANRIGIINDHDQLLKEIFESGLLKGDISRFDFIHPTAIEFFHARYLSIQSSEIAMSFVSEMHNRDECIETILFLIGILRNKGNQDMILDFLEENNIEIYIKSLKSRYHTDLSEAIYYHDVESRYLSQLQKTYNRLLDGYLANIKFRFSPYRFMESDPVILNQFKVGVKGTLDMANSRILYEYFPYFINADVTEPEIVHLASGYLNPSVRVGNSKIHEIIAYSNGKQFYKDLNLARLGIDSAREVAVNDVFMRLEELIDKKLLPMTPIFACELVVAEIHKASSKARMFQDKDLEPIWKFEIGAFEAQEYLQVFESIKEHPFVICGNRQIPINIKKIIHLLKYLIANSISISNFILPPISPFSKAYGNSNVFSAGWNSCDQKEIQRRLERLYSMLPKIYYEFVKLNFPRLIPYLGHCKIYPYKYIVNYCVGNGRFHDDWIIKRYHIPVASEDEMIASVNLVENADLKRDDFDILREQYIKMLRRFERYSEANSEKFFVTHGGIDSIMDDKALTKSIYTLLDDDLKMLFMK
jgi:hypothetical protein